jgi:hypothetical protein
MHAAFERGWLAAGYDTPTTQDSATRRWPQTMIYTHVRHLGSRGVKIPFDILF